MVKIVEKENGGALQRQQQLLGKEIVRNASDDGFLKIFARRIKRSKTYARSMASEFLEALATFVEGRDYSVVPDALKPREGLLRRFPPNWEGKMPRPLSRRELTRRCESYPQRRGWSPKQVKKFLLYRVRFEWRYYVSPEGLPFHRACKGGSVLESSQGVYCANCGPLPALIPPSFFSFNGSLNGH